MDPQGNQVILRGVAAISLKQILETGNIPSWGKGFDTYFGNLTSGDWEANVLRLTVVPGDYQADPDGYVNRVLKPAVDACTARGVYCIVDYHHIDDPRNHGEPDGDVSRFWSHVAPLFAGYSNVLYEVFNEPTKLSWGEWRAVAQPWLDTIRSSAPDTVVVMGGPQWTSHMEGAGTDPFEGENIAYALHYYPGSYLPQGRDYHVPHDKVPFIMTEWGYWDGTDQTTRGDRSYGVDLKQWADQNGIGMTCWVASHDWFPPMFRPDGSLTDFGDFCRSWVADN